MNPSLLVVIGEGTVKGQVGIRWFTILEFAAEGMVIFDSFFSLVQKIAISLTINSLQCFIVIGGLFCCVNTGGS